MFYRDSSSCLKPLCLHFSGEEARGISDQLKDERCMNGGPPLVYLSVWLYNS